MAIFEEYIYFTEWKAVPRVYRISKYCDDQNGGVKCAAEPMSQILSQKPMGIIIINSLVQPELPGNPCERKPCGENHLCLLRPNGPDGVDRTCIGDKNLNMELNMEFMDFISNQESQLV